MVGLIPPAFSWQRISRYASTSFVYFSRTQYWLLLYIHNTFLGVSIILLGIVCHFLRYILTSNLFWLTSLFFYYTFTPSPLMFPTSFTGP